MSVILEIRSFLRSWSKPRRDPLYRRFIKSLPCFACGQTWQVDPCHTGPHAISQKADDYTCIPLCRKCHDRYDKAPYDFQARMRWDMPEVLAFFQHLYTLKIGRHVRDLPAEKRRAA